MKYPSKFERYGSLLVDLVTLGLIIWLMLNSSSYGIKYAAVLVPPAYFLILHSLFSRSIGDLVFNLRITDRTGNRIGFRLAFRRFLCVCKYSIWAGILTNLIFLLFMFWSGKVRSAEDVRFNYEGESETYLVKTKQQKFS